MNTKETYKVDIPRTMKVFIISVYLNLESIDDAFKVKYMLIFVIRFIPFVAIGNKGITKLKGCDINGKCFRKG